MRRRPDSGCARLAKRGHGSRYFQCSVPTLAGRRERVRRGGYGSRRAAEDARDGLLARSLEERRTQTWMVIGAVRPTA